MYNLYTFFFFKCSFPADGVQLHQLYHCGGSVPSGTAGSGHSGLRSTLPFPGQAPVQAAQPWVMFFTCFSLYLSEWFSLSSTAIVHMCHRNTDGRSVRTQRTIPRAVQQVTVVCSQFWSIPTANDQYYGSYIYLNKQLWNQSSNLEIWK